MSCPGTSVVNAVTAFHWGSLQGHIFLLVCRWGIYSLGSSSVWAVVRQQHLTAFWHLTLQVMARVCWFPNKFQYYYSSNAGAFGSSAGEERHQDDGVGESQASIGPSHWPSKHGRLFQGPISVMHVNEQVIPCESHKCVGLSHDDSSKLESGDKRESKAERNLQVF